MKITPKGLDKNKLKIVDMSEVPTSRVKVNKWQDIFDRIPVGKALVVTEDEVSFIAVRCALYDLKRKGLYKNLRARKVREENGKYKLYVIHSSEEEIEKKHRGELPQKQQ